MASNFAIILLKVATTLSKEIYCLIQVNRSDIRREIRSKNNCIRIKMCRLELKRSRTTSDASWENLSPFLC